MKIAKFEWQGSVHWGIVEDDRIFAVNGHIYGDLQKREALCSLNDVRLLAPAEPSIMVGCVLTYRDRIKQVGRIAFQELSLFYKLPGSLVGPLEEIRFPAESRDNHCEAELCVVLKRQAKKVAEKDAFDYVLGYTCGNDCNAFDFYHKDENLTRAKGFDTAGPLGPFLVTDIDPSNLAIRSRVNGELIQDSNTRNMIFDIPKLISHITAFMTLNPGDVIWTGTPKSGAIPVNAGDIFEVEIEGIGFLKNRIAAPV